MSGYTPVFDSVFKGSLYGKWPDTAAWLCMLALADWRGQIDYTPEAISGITGMPLVELLGCIERFCLPDPRSRSKVDEGRKLVLIDPDQGWGWRIVNIQKYREKARDQNKVSDGRNAERLRNKRAKKDPRRPPATPGDPRRPTRTLNSDSDSDSDKNLSIQDKPANTFAGAQPQRGLGGGNLPPKHHTTLPQTEWLEWIDFRRQRRWPLDAVTLKKQLKVLAGHDSEIQKAMLANSIQAGWQGLFPLKGPGAGPKKRLPLSGHSPTTEELEAKERELESQR